MVKLCSIILSAVLLSTSIAQGNERSFTYTYQTAVLGAGQREIEVWSTMRWQRDEFFRRFDHRMEYEIGLGGNLQTAFYLNLTTVAQLVRNPAPEIERAVEFGFSNEWKYKMSDPVADALGSALYGEIGIGANEIELEGKVILDKQFESMTHALNLVAEPEWETKTSSIGSETEFELHLEAAYGFCYAINERVNLGIEVRNINEIKDGDLMHSVLFGGPVVSYTTSGWWATLTVLPQLYAFRTEPGNVRKHLELQARERLETRLIFSFEL